MPYLTSQAHPVCARFSPASRLPPAACRSVGAQCTLGDELENNHKEGEGRPDLLPPRFSGTSTSLRRSPAGPGQLMWLSRCSPHAVKWTARSKVLLRAHQARARPIRQVELHVCWSICCVQRLVALSRCIPRKSSDHFPRPGFYIVALVCHSHILLSGWLLQNLVRLQHVPLWTASPPTPLPPSRGGLPAYESIFVGVWTPGKAAMPQGHIRTWLQGRMHASADVCTSTFPSRQGYRVSRRPQSHLKST